MMKKEENLEQMYEYIKIPEVEDQFAFRIIKGKLYFCDKMKKSMVVK